LSAPVLSASAQDQGGTDLSLEEAVSLALEYNLNLQKDRIDLEASGYSEKNLWSEIFPSINASARAGFSNALFSGSGSSQDSVLSYSAGLGLSLSLNAGIPYAMRSIKLAHQGNILRYEDACSQLSIQVTKKYYSLVAEKNNLLLLEEILSLAQKQYEKSEVSFRNGLLGELSLLQSGLAVENARYNLISASTAYANSMAEFLAMLGMPSDSRVTLLGEVNIVRINTDPEALITEHLPLRPDIVRSTQEIERLRYAHTQSLLQNRAPSVNLSLDWNVSSFDPLAERLSGSANLNIPLDSWIPGTARNQTVRRTDGALEKARLDLAIIQDAAKNQIRSLAALLRNSWDSITIARLGFSTAQRSYQLTEQGFLNGTVEALALEDARNNMANARQRLLQSELSYFNMILDLSAALNIDWKNLIQTFGEPSEKR
jgi:multidrug efflux system outer membrane protein